MRRVVPLVLLGVIGVPGCGGPVGVSGEVTVDGQPPETGLISFAPADGAGGPVTAEIRKGKYSLSTSPGKKWVQISVPVVIDKRPMYKAPDAPLMDITEESIPERYNARTELTFDVTRGGNTKNWSIESKKGGKP
jgi:hypothetical protein